MTGRQPLASNATLTSYLSLTARNRYTYNYLYAQVITDDFRCWRSQAIYRGAGALTTPTIIS